MASYRDYSVAHQTASSTWQLSGAPISGATTVRGTAMPVARELQPQPHLFSLEPHPSWGHVGLPEVTNSAPALATVVVVVGVNRFRYWQRGP